MSAEVPTVFISHISEEGALAGVLKKHLLADFGGRVKVFVSSDLEDITAGRDWLKSVRDALDVAGVELILCSRPSVNQPSCEPLRLHGHAALGAGRRTGRRVPDQQSDGEADRLRENPLPAAR